MGTIHPDAGDICYFVLYYSSSSISVRPRSRTSHSLPAVKQGGTLKTDITNLSATFRFVKKINYAQHILLKMPTHHGGY